MSAEAHERRGYLERLRSVVERDRLPVAGVLAGLTLQLAGGSVGVRLRVDGDLVDPVDVPAPPAHAAVPDLLGWVLEALLSADQRRAGAHFTSVEIADGLVALAVERAGPGDVCCDPACGGGAFLLALARRLEALGCERRVVVAELVRGFDIDPLSVGVAEAALGLWAGDPDVAAGSVAVADALGADLPGAGEYAVVVGNPPFQGQLTAATSRSKATTTRLSARYGAAARGYVDTAGLFLLAATGWVRPGGRVALIEPQSLLGARDAGVVRRAVREAGSVDGFWVGDADSFAAAVDVCALVVTTAAPQSARIRRWVGDRFVPVDDADGAVVGGVAWPSLLSDLQGTPRVSVTSTVTVGSVASATAGFRDEYYGLVPAAREARRDGGGVSDDAPPLVTVGLIDPLECRWGHAPARFAKQRFDAPVVDLARIDSDRVRSWVDARLGAKLLVATQTRVIEVIVDEAGALVPVTPVISVHAPRQALWHLAAALSSPPLSALALHRTTGAALTVDAIKLSASQVLDLPLPAEGRAWDEGAEAARRASHAVNADERAGALAELATAMCAAYEVDEVDAEPLVDWWTARLPARRR